MNDTERRRWLPVLDAQQEGMENPYSLDDMTCSSCADRNSCEYAFDLYNTNGDCLAEK